MQAPATGHSDIDAELYDLLGEVSPSTAQSNTDEQVKDTDTKQQTQPCSESVAVLAAETHHQSQMGKSLEPPTHQNETPARTTGNQEQQTVCNDDDNNDHEMMAVVCPDGVIAGDMISVDTPDGREIEIDVPEGIRPGDVFDVFIGILTDESDSDAT